jgi:hypothetical protein
MRAKKRGRPRKIPEPRLGDVGEQFAQVPEKMRGMLGIALPSERTNANRHYARIALDRLKEVTKLPPGEARSDPALAARWGAGLAWIRQRPTVLSELGRMMGKKPPTEEDHARFYDALRYVALKRPGISAKEAAGYIRRVRLGRTSKRAGRVRSLHREVNRLIATHRRTHPEGTWAEVLEALERSVAQVRKKVR